MTGSVVGRAPTASAIAAGITAIGGPIGGSPIPRAERAETLPRFQDHGLDVGHIGGRRDHVLEQPGREVHAVLHHEVFEQRLAEPLHHGAGDLSFDAHRVDRTADVVRRDIPQHLHLARVQIDLDVCQMRAEREIGKDPVALEVARDLFALRPEERPECLDRHVPAAADLQGGEQRRGAVGPHDLAGLEAQRLGRLAGSAATAPSTWSRSSTAASYVALPDISSCRVAVVVPASGVSAESPKCTLIRSMSTARISLAI